MQRRDRRMLGCLIDARVLKRLAIELEQATDFGVLELLEVAVVPIPRDERDISVDAALGDQRVRHRRLETLCEEDTPTVAHAAPKSIRYFEDRRAVEQWFQERPVRLRPKLAHDRRRQNKLAANHRRIDEFDIATRLARQVGDDAARISRDQ